MNQTIKNILAHIKGMNASDAMYGSILIVFFIVVGGTFIIAVRFISSNINAIFSGETGDTGLGLNKERYERTLKKLDITTTAPSLPQATVETPVPVPEPVANTATTTSEATDTTVAPPPLDRSTITLMIKNSTVKKGAAGTLASALQKAGFAVATTSNESQKYSVTTILLKEDKYDYAALILEEVVRSYPGAIATSTTNTASYDATIIIGEK